LPAFAGKLDPPYMAGAQKRIRVPMAFFVIIQLDRVMRRYLKLSFRVRLGILRFGVIHKKVWPFLIRNEDGENRRWGDRENGCGVGPS
jgi:hypothetical protein